MNKQCSKCDVPDHTDEDILGLCLDKACLQKPEYCFFCKTEGKHANHQNKCYSFQNLQKKFSQTKNTLDQQRNLLINVMQNASKYLTDFLNINYQQQIDDCKLQISISNDENVQQSKNKIELFQYFSDLNYEELSNYFLNSRKIHITVEEVCQKFMDEMEKIMVQQKIQISAENESIIQESQSSRIILSQNSQIKKAEQINDDEEIFKQQLKQIQEFDQAYSFKLSYKANQLVGNSQKFLQLLGQAIQLYENNQDALLQKGTILYNMGKYDESMAILDKLINQNTQESKVYSIYASCLYFKQNINSLSQKDKVQEADEFYQKAILLNLIDSSLYLSRVKHKTQKISGLKEQKNYIYRKK